MASSRLDILISVTNQAKGIGAEIAREVGKITHQLDEIGGHARSANAKLETLGKGGAASMRDLDSATRGVVGSLASMAAKIALIATGVAAFKSFADAGVRFNSTIESATLGFATLFTALGEVRDETGKLVKGPEALNAALKISEEQMRKLRIAGIQTAATTQQLALAFQTGIGSGLSAGLNVDQIRQLTIQVSQAASAINLPQEQLAQEIQSLLSGNISADSRIAKALGITNQMVVGWKESNTLFEELQKRFEPFSDAGEKVAQTWEATKSNIEEARDTIAGIATAGYFEQIKTAAQQALSGVFDLKSAGISENIKGLVDELKGVFDTLGNLIAGGIRLATQALFDLSGWIDNNYDHLSRLGHAFGDFMSSSLVPFLGLVGEAITEFIKWAVESDSLAKALEFVTSVFKAMAPVVEEAKNAVGFFFEAVTEGSPASETMIATVEKGFAALSLSVKQMALEIREAWAEAINWVTDKVSGLARSTAAFVASDIPGTKGVADALLAKAEQLDKSKKDLSEFAQENAKAVAQYNDMVAGIDAAAEDKIKAADEARAASERRHAEERKQREAELKKLASGGSLPTVTNRPDLNTAGDSKAAKGAQDDIKQIADANRAYRKEQIELELRDRQDGLKREEEILKASLDKKQISEAEYYQRLATLRTQDLDAEIEAKRQEVELIREKIAATSQIKDEGQRESALMSARSELARVTQEITLLERQRGDVARETGDKVAEARKKELDGLLSVLEKYDEQLARQRKFDADAKVIRESTLLSEADKAKALQAVGEAYGKAGEKSKETTDKMSEFSIQAARNMQSAFADFLFDPFDSGLKGMLKSFADTLRRMAAEAISAKLFDALLGKQDGKGGTVGGAAGSGGGIFDLFKGLGGGGSGSGGGFMDFLYGIGNFFGGLFAEGGMVTGPGTGTSDSIVARVSNGEFVMPAAVTAQYLPLLEAMRVGRLGSLVSGMMPVQVPRIPHYAAGGLVDTGVVGKGGGSSVRIINTIDPDLVHDYLSSSQGEKVILNHIQRNAGSVKSLLR